MHSSALSDDPFAAATLIRFICLVTSALLPGLSPGLGSAIGGRKARRQVFARPERRAFVFFDDADQKAALTARHHADIKYSSL